MPLAGAAPVKSLKFQQKGLDQSGLGHYVRGVNGKLNLLLGSALLLRRAAVGL
jgi:hypothetical protein